MNETTEKNGSPSMEETFLALEKACGFDLSPCSTALDLGDTSRFTRLVLNDAQKMNLSALMQQAPTLAAAGTLAQAYIVRFPEGIPHTLTALKQGGFGSMVQGSSGRFAGSASFYPMQSQAVLLGVFSAMSVATCQYFLTQINRNMDKMNLKLDKILEFLYGDKKAELIAEINFTKYAFESYPSVMTHESQRIASITSLQASRKVAMKDIEFYLSDLDSAKDAGKAIQIRDSLELAIQLYVMSSLLEVYYAQNYDTAYLSALERDMTAYIEKCEKRTLRALAALNEKLKLPKPALKVNPLDVVKKPGPRPHQQEKEINRLIDSLNTGEESDLRKNVREALRAAKQAVEYYIDSQQNVYIKRT